MKSLSIDLTVSQVSELKTLIASIVNTGAIHLLRYSQAVTLQRGYVRICNKHLTLIHRKQNRKYKISFVPIEAETIVLFIGSAIESKIVRLTPYAQTTYNQFRIQVDQQQMDLMQTFLSQFPFA